MVFTILKNTLNLGNFTHAPVPHSKFQAEYLKICFPAAKRVEKTLSDLIDLLYQNSVIKYDDDLEQ